MDIAIVGAGISGCMAYLQLKKHLPKPPSGAEHTITLYEAYDVSKDTTSADREHGETHSASLIVGGGLAVGANGLNVMKRLDEELLRDVTRGGYVVETMNMKSKGGALLCHIQPANVPSATDTGEPKMHSVSSSRDSLWKNIRKRVPDDRIINKRVAKVTAQPDGRNVITFVDGSPQAEVDLVIGADGVKSLTKLALFPDADEDPFPPHYEGLVGVGGFIKIGKAKKHVEKGSLNFIFGPNGFFGYFFSESAASAPNRESPFHVSEPGDSLSWWSTYSVDECPDARNIDKEAVTRQLQERHKKWKDPVIREILKSLQVTSMYPTWTVPALPTWERDGVILIGDAAHALPPTSGQGSSQALEDTEALALFLEHFLAKAYDEEKKDPDIMGYKTAVTTAAKNYMNLRQPRIKSILGSARQHQDNKRDIGTVGEYMMYGFMWLMGRFSGAMANQLNTVSDYNIADEVKKAISQQE